MIHYIRPHYKIDLSKDGVYRIIVDVKPSQTTPKNVPLARKNLLHREARKNPLNAMALINKLANERDLQAMGFRTLYKTYRKFLGDRDKHAFKLACGLLLTSKEIDPFVRDCTSYLHKILNGESIENRLQAAKRFLNDLIPWIEETINTPSPRIAIPQQEVKVPEMVCPHNAFPDLIKYHGHFYACFREAKSHVRHGDRGKIRILKGAFSREAQSWNWETSGLLAKPGFDLRDPKFFIDGKDTLNLIIGGSVIGKDDKTVKMVPHAARMEKGGWTLDQAITDPACDGPKGQWIWKVVWNPYDNQGYGLAYGLDEKISLVATHDGKEYRKIAEISCPPLTELNEAALRFKSDGTAIALIRTRRNGIIALSSPKSGYAEWTCTIVPFRLGGPDFVIDKKRETMWSATRHFFINPNNTLDEAMIVAKMTPSKLIPLLRLRSANDCSYPGIVLQDDGTLAIIYYSGENPSSCNIYITSVNNS